MLRRVIVPFVELFFILLLVFITLYLITASLSGEGDARAQDELHVLEVQLNIPVVSRNTWINVLSQVGLPLDSSFTLPSGIFRDIGHTLEAATLSSYASKEGWAFGWSLVGRGDWNVNDRLSVVSEGVCTQFTNEKAHLRNGEHRLINAFEGELTAPSSALSVISTGRQNPDLTVLVDYKIADELHTTNVRVLFQPREIERQTLLRFGVPVFPTIEGQSRAHESISFVHEVLGNEVRVDGAITTPVLTEDEFVNIKSALSIAPAQWSSILQASAQVTTGSLGSDASVPMIFSLPDCAAFPMIYLYVILGPSGVELSLNPPRHGQ